MAAAKIHRHASARAAVNPASTARFRLPRKMWESACPTRTGCRVRSSKTSPLVTGRVLRNSTNAKNRTAHAEAPTVQRQLISAKVNDGRRKAARKPSMVGETRDMCDQDNARRGLSSEG